MRTNFLWAVWLVALAALFAVRPVWSAQPAAIAREAQKLLAANCFACHGLDEDSRESGLRLDLREAAIAEADSGERAIAPGDPDASELLVRVTSDDEDLRMPPAGEGAPLGEQEVALLRDWIAAGADYQQHWSLVPPRAAALPQVGRRDWRRNPIDDFILARLTKKGLQPSPEADRATLIRRLSLDLTGLPPTRDEVQQFVADTSDGAYERLVDRLLRSSAYGERWASLWLDLARYADTDGYSNDARRAIWPYRDWVIDALNADMPFDQFTIEQLAGDLLPGATPQQILATAFHRNTMTNSEGGTINEEFRVEAVKDRVDTTMQVWMGLTMGCAKCHTHKFDPITMTEYYQFFAFFNQTEDADRNDNSPKLPVRSGDTLLQARKLQARIAELKRQAQQTDSVEFAAALRRWEEQATADIDWVPLDYQKVHSQGGATIQRLDDESLLVSGDNPATDVLELTARTDLKQITGVRIEALPHESLGGGGPGRTAHGNFVLSELQMSTSPADDTRPAGRYVRIDLPGDKRMIHIAELQVFSAAVNVARQGQADQSSTDFQGQALRAIDGNTSGDYAHASVTHTGIEKDPWFQLDLGAEHPIDRIVLWNRTDNGWHKRLNGAKLSLLDEGRHELWSTQLETAPAESAQFRLTEQAAVRFTRATATFEQGDSASNPHRGWKAVAAIDDDRHGAKWGWAIAPQFGKSHTAIFETAADTTADPGAGPGRLLHLRLLQNFGQQHALGRLRIAVTAAPRPVFAVPLQIAEILAVAAEARTPQQKAALSGYFGPIHATGANAEIARLEKELAGLKPVATPIMRELPTQRRRTTLVLIKGNYLTHGEQVQPDVPDAFHAFPADAPQNRLGLARWLMHPDNPLTARVLVNRFWSQLMGRGIVETEEDFGAMGLPPTHPKLLDWLALHVQQQDWSLKALVKTIVMSATYRQSSAMTPELVAKDPRNLYFARGPRFRLSAEQVRDQALALGGILNRQMYGPSVNPPRPFDPLSPAFSGEKVRTSQGAAARRRGLYTFLRRTNPYPSMLTFDGTSREICTIRRVRTNTPLQALVTLNDPVYVEAAEGLARRIVRAGGSSVVQRMDFALRLVTCRAPQQSEIDRLVRLYQRELEYYRNHHEAARQMAAQHLGPIADVDLTELAAWTVIANVLLNLDEVLVRG